MNILERYVSYIRSSLKEGWQGILGSFIGYSMLGVVIFFVILPFAFVLTFFFSSFLSPETGFAVIKGYFLFFFPTYWLLIFLINGFMHEREFVEDSLGKITPSEVNEILEKGSETEILRTIRLLPKSELSKVYIRETLRKMANSAPNHKIRETAITALGKFIEKNPMGSESTKRLVYVDIEDVATNVSSDTIMLKERKIIIENRSENSLDIQIATAGHNSELIHFPIYKPKTVSFEINKSFQSLLAISVTKALDRLIMHLTNVSAFPIIDFEIHLSEGYFVGESGEDEGSFLRISNLEPNTTINLSISGYSENSKMEVHYVQKSETTDEVTLYRKHDSDLVKITSEELSRTLTDKTLRLKMTVQNSSGFDLVLNSLELDYLSEDTPSGQILKMETDEILQEVGETHLLTQDHIEITREVTFPIDEHPTFKGFVDYILPITAERTLKVSWIIPIAQNEQ